MGGNKYNRNTVKSLLSPPGGLLISSTLMGAYWRKGAYKRGGLNKYLKYENFFTLNTNDLLLGQKALTWPISICSTSMFEF